MRNQVGKCLVNDEEPYMAAFDRLPPLIRRFINEEPVKLCPACARDELIERGFMNPELSDDELHQEVITWFLSEVPELQGWQFQWGAWYHGGPY